MSDRPKYVAFVEKSLETAFEKLRQGKFEDEQLYKFISRAIVALKKEPMCGIKIPKKLWPKIFIQKYEITNLWKYDLPNGWRLVYTIKTDEVRIISVILEWFDHKGYERRFGY